MRRAFGIGALVAVILAVVVAGAAAVQQVYGDRQYRRLLTTGEQALAAGNGYSAVEAFSGALAFRPDSMVAHLRRGEAYRLQKRHVEAVRDLRQAVRLAPEAPQPLVALGDLFEANGQPAEAADWYLQAADRLKGEDPALLYKLALAYYKAGSPGAAVEPLKQAVSRDEASAEGRYLLGLVYRDTGDVPSAIAALQSAIGLRPNFVAAREELADIHRVEGRRVDEIAQLQALAAADGADHKVERTVAIGLAEARQGQLEGALGTLSRVLAEAPNDSRVHLAIGRVHLARAERTPSTAPQSVARAMESFDRALAGSAPRSEGLALYGRALYLSGNDSQAERLLRDAIATSPVHLEAYAFLADISERLGHTLVARDALMNLDALQGDTASTGVRLSRSSRIGELSLRAGDAKTAIAFLSRAFDAGNPPPYTVGLLAHARWLTGDAASARDLIARALAAGPEDARIQRIARLIR